MKKTKIKIFQPNLIYVFSYKKCKKSTRKMKMPIGWAKEFNGRPVTPSTNPRRAGTILGSGLSINIKWCKCIGRKAANEKRNSPGYHGSKASRTKLQVCG